MNAFDPKYDDPDCDNDKELNTPPWIDTGVELEVTVVVQLDTLLESIEQISNEFTELVDTGLRTFHAAVVAKAHLPHRQD